MDLGKIRIATTKVGLIVLVCMAFGTRLDAQRVSPATNTATSPMTFRSIASGKPETSIGQVRITGYSWQQSSARMPISIQQARMKDDRAVWRFEVNRGQNEVAPGPNVAKYAMRDRSELWMLGAAPGRFEKIVCVQYDLYVDQMPSAKGQWNVLGQWHAVEDPGDSHLSPVLAFEYDDGTARIVTRSDEDPVQKVNPIAISRWSDTSYPLQRWVNWRYEVHFSRGSDNGILRVWEDGKQVVDLSGIPIGYNDRLQPRFQFGIYRGNNVSGKAVAFYDNVLINDGSCS